MCWRDLHRLHRNDDDSAVDIVDLRKSIIPSLKFSDVPIGGCERKLQLGALINFRFRLSKKWQDDSHDYPS